LPDPGEDSTLSTLTPCRAKRRRFSARSEEVLREMEQFDERVLVELMALHRRVENPEAFVACAVRGRDRDAHGGRHTEHASTAR
jgi:hypothetical protein